MEENEARIAALEGLLMERLALDEPGRLAQLRIAVMAWPRGRQRAQALIIIEDAMRRFDEVEIGSAVKRR